MVGAYGSVHIHKKFLPELSIASVELDLENKQNIENNLDDLPKIIPILSKWFIEHTIGAKELAILYCEESKGEILKNRIEGIKENKTTGIECIGACELEVKENE